MLLGLATKPAQRREGSDAQQSAVGGNAWDGKISNSSDRPARDTQHEFVSCLVGAVIRIGVNRSRKSAAHSSYRTNRNRLSAARDERSPRHHRVYDDTGS